MKDIRSERLDKLLDATILNYYDSVDSDNYMDLYDKMFEHLVDGDFNDSFICPKLDEADEETKKKVFDLAKKYSSLCFYDGDVSYWADSVEGFGVLDLDTLSIRILDNYNFVLETAYEYGEEALDFINKFKSSNMAAESALIDYLRNTFGDDKALKKTIYEFTKEDSIYKGLDEYQREILFTYPNGIIYKYNSQGKLEFSSKEYLLGELSKRSMDEDTYRINSISQMAEYLGDYDFENYIRDMYLDYRDIKKHNVLKRK